jgi:DNA-binding response OmpR family regulator
LVVEDEPTVAALIGDVLREEGMEVDVSLDGHGALECTRKVSYDLVICDVNMPTMDGQLFFQSLQEAHNPLREPVLFVSGDELAPRTKEFLARHQLPHVAKPFRVEELCLAVRSLLCDKLQADGAWGEPIMKNDLGTGRTDEGTTN